MARKKSEFELKRPVHITIKDKDLENIVDLIKENPTSVKLTRAAAVRISIALTRKLISEIPIEELEAFFKEHRTAA